MKELLNHLAIILVASVVLAVAWDGEELPEEVKKQLVNN